MTTLIGTNPDQVPVNSMLGGMAYQDPDSVKVRDLTVVSTASINTATIDNLTTPVANLTNVTYTGTLTGGTGVINIGSNQIYKDASGNVGVGAVPVSNGKTLTLVNTSSGPSSFYLQNSNTGFTTTDGTLLQLSGSAAYLWNFENSTLSLATNNTEYVRLTSTGDLLNLGTGATKLQEGTTAQRPASPQEGMIRKNSTLGVIEGYSGGGWVDLQTGNLLNVQVFDFFSNGGSAVDVTLYDVPYTRTVGAKTLVLRMIGGGGSGGGTPTTGAGQVAAGGSGNSGTYAEVRCTAPSSGYITLGRGGTAVTGGNGQAGDATVFSLEPFASKVNYISVSGGERGDLAVATTPPVESFGALGTATVTLAGSFSTAKVLTKHKEYGGRTLILNTSGVGAGLSTVNYNPLAPVSSTYGFGGIGGTAGPSSAATPGLYGYCGSCIIYEYS